VEKCPWKQTYHSREKLNRADERTKPKRGRDWGGGDITLRYAGGKEKRRGKEVPEKNWARGRL